MTAPHAPTTAPGDSPPDAMSRWRLVSRRAPESLRTRVAASLRASALREVARVDLLAPDALESLARRSLVLLLLSGVAYAGLDALARAARGSGPLLGVGSPLVPGLVLLAANAVAYAAVLPLHEAVHAAVIAGLGGRPRFGHKLPFALYCTAPGQLFTRDGYTAIALAPLVALSALLVAVAWIAPELGAFLVLAFAGNASGAIADLDAVAHVRALPADALIADTETGFAAYVPADHR